MTLSVTSSTAATAAIDSKASVLRDGISSVLRSAAEVVMRFVFKVMVVAIALAGAPAGHTIADPTNPTVETLRHHYALHVGGLYGVYLGNGLVITAAHVAYAAAVRAFYRA